MTTNTTAAGIAHLAERDASAPLTDAFDGFELGKGNVDITLLVTRDIATAKLTPPGILEVLAPYPMLDDQDDRNPGRGADWWTWAFRVSGAEHGPLVASEGWITNYASGMPLVNEPVGFSFNDIFQLRSDQVATIFVNAKTGSTATVYFSYEEETSGTATAATYAQRFPLIATYPQSVSRTPQRVSAEIAEGAPVYVMARALGEFGHLLVREDVTRCRARLFVENEVTGRWDELSLDGAYSPDENVSNSAVVTDLRWPHSKGYNVGMWVDTHALTPGQRACIELEIRTRRGLLEPPVIDLTILPRAGRYSLD